MIWFDNWLFHKEKNYFDYIKAHSEKSKGIVDKMVKIIIQQSE